MSKKSGVDKILLDKYFNNQCSADERQVVLDWLSNPENKLLAHEVMQSQWDQLENELGDAFQMEEVLAKTREKSFECFLIDKRKSEISDIRNKKSKSVLWKMAAVWSGIIILILSGLFLTLNRDQSLLANEHQTQVKSSSGEIILKVLSDGTKVWLNAQSSISFPSSFDGDSIREVLLNGEAFFDVAEDKEHPFIVRTRDINIRVMGTAFNVKSYDGDSTVKTTLVRGRVVVEHKNGRAEKIELKPNQQAVFSQVTEQITLLDVHVEKHTSWNSGSLVFEDDSLLDVIRSLERWYGVVIHVQDKSNMECRLTARIDKESLVETLEILRSLTGIHYSVKEKDVFIEGKICE